MAGYKIFFRKSVEKDLMKIPARDLKAILKKIESLGDNPRPQGCEKLSLKEQYRIRHGKYRILYSIQDNDLTVWVVKVAHRKDAYR
jgi:mRNA interferase RelE/StbE